MLLSGRQDSNLRSPAPKAGALATTLRPARGVPRASPAYPGSAGAVASERDGRAGERNSSATYRRDSMAGRVSAADPCCREPNPYVRQECLLPSTVEQLSPTRVKLIIEIPFADLKPAIDKAYNQIGSQITVPGFRKGKVPAAVINPCVFGGSVSSGVGNGTSAPAGSASSVTQRGVSRMRWRTEITMSEI